MSIIVLLVYLKFHLQCSDQDIILNTLSTVLETLFDGSNRNVVSNTSMLTAVSSMMKLGKGKRSVVIQTQKQNKWMPKTHSQVSLSRPDEMVSYVNNSFYDEDPEYTYCSDYECELTIPIMVFQEFVCPNSEVDSHSESDIFGVL